MAAQPEIRQLHRAEVSPAAEMLARAFAQDPLTALLAPDPARREAKAQWYFSVVARYGLAFGEVWTVGNVDGAAIWWGPGAVTPSPARAAYAGFDEGEAVLGVDVWEQTLEIGWMVADVHERAISEPHWYLNTLGVRPERQRAGLGRALLTSMLDRLDRERLPVYLDTGTAENVAYYQQHGFQLAAEDTDERTGVRIYGMCRTPH
ncbi:MAG: GNAT family N-acetyltransferase [Chloroflexota bacterium]